MFVILSIFKKLWISISLSCLLDFTFTNAKLMIIHLLQQQHRNTYMQGSIPQDPWKYCHHSFLLRTMHRHLVNACCTPFDKLLDLRVTVNNID